jgi:succinoglycan biosynthesis protein ExoU
MTANVSIIIAARNAERTIGRAVQSALHQRSVRQVIVVDDESSDGTSAAAHAEANGSAELLVIRLDSNRGPAAARNEALAKVTSQYIAILDADDFFLDGRLEHMFASAPEQWDFIADDILIVPENYGDPRLNSLAVPTAGPMQVDLETFVLGNISRTGRHRRELGFLKPIFRLDFLRDHGLSYRENLRLGEDFALYVEALAAGAKFWIVNRCGYVAIARAASLSSSHKTSDLAEIVAFDDYILENTQSLNDRERQALRRHRLSIYKKFVYGAVLDRCRTSGYGAAFRLLAKHTTAAPFVFSETLRGKAANAVRRRSSGPGANKEPQMLIGSSEISVGWK